MSLECSECEHDLRGGHDPSCSRYVAPCKKCQEESCEDEEFCFCECHESVPQGKEIVSDIKCPCGSKEHSACNGAPSSERLNLGELRKQLESIGNKWAVPGTAFDCIVAKMVEVLDRERTYVWEQAHAHYRPIIEQREREARLEGRLTEHMKTIHFGAICTTCVEIKAELAKLKSQPKEGGK